MPPDWDEFPCLRLAFEALDADRSLPIVLNAANEVAVASFLEGTLAFPAIPEVIAAAMARPPAGPGRHPGGGAGGGRLGPRDRALELARAVELQRGRTV